MLAAAVLAPTYDVVMLLAAACLAGGDAWVALEVDLQVLLAAGAVGTAVLVEVLLLRLPVRQPAVCLQTATGPGPASSVGAHGQVVGGVRGRGPPVPVRP